MNLIADRFVAYYRTSKSKQSLGLQAQRSLVLSWLGTRPLIKKFEEHGKSDDAGRVELNKAIDTCKLTNSTLLVAKQDRLERGYDVIGLLEKSGVNWIACEREHASAFEKDIKSAVDKEELRQIRARTKAALAVVKANIERDGYHVSKRSGRKITKLGSRNIRPEDGAKGGRAAAVVVKGKADDFAKRVMPLIRAFIDNGLSYHATADRLNEMGIQTARNGRWQAITVQRVMAR